MKLFPKDFIVPLVLVSVVAFFVADYYISNTISNRNIQEVIITPTHTPETTVTPRDNPTKKLHSLSNDTDLPHELLPGFDIQASSDWSLAFKQFGEKDSIGFVSKYWGGFGNSPIPQESMGIRIKKGNASLDLVFDIINDDNRYDCSDTVTFDNIGNGWYRITDSSGFFYTNKAEEHRTPFSGNVFGTLSDEWSVVGGHVYKICYQGSGVYFRNDPPKIITPPQGGGLMLENPRINGTPARDQLIEIDTMVKSIQGLK